MATKDERPGVHIRLYEEDVKIRSWELDKIYKAAKFCGLSISEFCRMATMKETRRVLLSKRKDIVEISKKILLEEKIRLEKERLKKEIDENGE